MTGTDPMARALRDLDDLRRQAALLVAQNAALRARLSECEAEIALLSAQILARDERDKATRSDKTEPKRHGLARWFGIGS